MIVLAINETQIKFWTSKIFYRFNQFINFLDFPQRADLLVSRGGVVCFTLLFYFLKQSSYWPYWFGIWSLEKQREGNISQTVRVRVNNIYLRIYHKPGGGASLQNAANQETIEFCKSGRIGIELISVRLKGLSRSPNPLPHVTDDRLKSREKK